MFLQTQQPTNRCSQCGSTVNYLEIRNYSIITDGSYEETWIVCNSCKHSKLQSTMKTATFGHSPSIYTLPPQPEFKDF